MKLSFNDPENIGNMLKSNEALKNLSDSGNANPSESEFKGAFDDVENILWDDDKKLFYRKNEFIFKLEHEISNLQNSILVSFKIKEEDTPKELQIEVLRSCEFSKNTLLLLKIDDLDIFNNNIENIQVQNVLVEHYCPHYLLYSPGDDDLPLPKQPLGAEYNNEPNKKGEIDDTNVYKYLESHITLKEISGYPVVAIMDTGIDLFYWKNYQCPLWKFGENENKIYGYNFVEDSEGYENNRPFDDNECNKHGTRIAKFIANRINNKVQLMILKTFNYQGFAKFFDIFCAFEFILKHKEVNVINASWGYYGRSIELFKKYLEEFKDNKIWFITAAGNFSDFNRIVDIGNVYVVNKSGQVDKLQRFPACYSRNHSLPNVITVTTLKSKAQETFASFFGADPQIRFELAENRSEIFVNVGVDAGKDGQFRDPISLDNIIKGSSYATPIFVGDLVKKISESGDPDSLTSTEMINSICTTVSSMSEGVRNNRAIIIETIL